MDRWNEAYEPEGTMQAAARGRQCAHRISAEFCSYPQSVWPRHVFRFSRLARVWESARRVARSHGRL